MKDLMPFISNLHMFTHPLCKDFLALMNNYRNVKTFMILTLIYDNDDVSIDNYRNVKTFMILTLIYDNDDVSIGGIGGKLRFDGNVTA